MTTYIDHFSINNIPFGIASNDSHPQKAVATRFEDTVIFLDELAKHHLPPDLDSATIASFSEVSLLSSPPLSSSLLIPPHNYNNQLTLHQANTQHIHLPPNPSTHPNPHLDPIPSLFLFPLNPRPTPLNLLPNPQNNPPPPPLNWRFYRLLLLPRPRPQRLSSRIRAILVTPRIRALPNRLSRPMFFYRCLRHGCC